MLSKKKKVPQLQMAPHLSINKCYRTVATESLFVLAGCLSFDQDMECNLAAENNRRKIIVAR